MDNNSKNPKNPKFHKRINELYERARDQDYTVGRIKFADMCGITKFQLNGYLSGNTEPSTSTLVKIAQMQNVSVSWLVGETDILRIETYENLKNLPVYVRDELDLLIKFLKFKQDEK